MKTILDLPDGLVNEVQARAQHQGLDLNDAVAELLRKGLVASGEMPTSQSRSPIKLNPQSGLPYIECSPEASARTMTIAELIEFEHALLVRDDRERNRVSPRQ